MSTETIAASVMMTNYPNPFKDKTTIRYQVEQETQIQISIFDVSGQLLTTLVNERKDAGLYGVNWNAGDLSSGIYFAKASNSDGEILQIQKLVKRN